MGASFSRTMTLVSRDVIELELQVGVGRDDGKSTGEFCPIFYRR